MSLPCLSIHALQNGPSSPLMALECQSCREYCKRLSLYRKRAWTCQLTGKVGLTYEEALVSEAIAEGAIQKVS